MFLAIQRLQPNAPVHRFHSAGLWRSVAAPAKADGHFKKRALSGDWLQIIRYRDGSPRSKRQAGIHYDLQGPRTSDSPLAICGNSDADVTTVQPEVDSKSHQIRVPIDSTISWMNPFKHRRIKQ